MKTGYVDHDASCNQTITQIYSDNEHTFIFCLGCGAEQQIPFTWTASTTTNMMLIENPEQPVFYNEEDPW